jgi:hypothetical protein
MAHDVGNETFCYGCLKGVCYWVNQSYKLPATFQYFLGKILTNSKKPTNMTYAEKLQDPRWQKKRLEIFERDSFACTFCGSKDHTLHVHHKYYRTGKEPWEYPDDCLKAVCKYCHQIIEQCKEWSQEVHEIKRLHMGIHCYAVSIYGKGEKKVTPENLMVAIIEFDRDGILQDRFLIWDSILTDITNLLSYPKQK